MGNQKKQFSKIYDQYVEKIFRFIFLKVSSNEIAQDLCSETFLRGWESYKTQKEIKNPQAFLYRIARNLVVDHYREKGKNQVVSAENMPIADPRPNLEEKMKLSSDIAVVHQGIKELKPDYQNVIIWHYLEGLPMKETAKLLNKSEPTTRVLLHRALKSLRKQIQEA